MNYCDDLYVFMCIDNKYCVRFADKNGIELTLKYLYIKNLKLLKIFVVKVKWKKN